MVLPGAALEGPASCSQRLRVVSGCCLLAAEGNYGAASLRTGLRMCLCQRWWPDWGSRASERGRQLLADVKPGASGQGCSRTPRGETANVFDIETFPPRGASGTMPLVGGPADADL